MPDMTEEEILKFRSDGIPDEVLVLMEEAARLAQALDRSPTPEDRERLRLALLTAQNRTQHYYQKRLKDFGIHNMRLKRILDSFPELLKSFGFPAS